MAGNPVLAPALPLPATADRGSSRGPAPARHKRGGQRLRSGSGVWCFPRSTGRLPDMAFVIDHVDLLGYLASDARLRDPATGTLVARLGKAAAFYLRETLPEAADRSFAQVFWEPGYYLVVRGGASIQPCLAAGAQIYAAGRLRRSLFETQGQTLCHTEIICTKADVLVLRTPDGGRT